MSVASIDSSLSSIDEEQQHITFFTIKCGEIFHTPDRQFFLLNCGVCGKGFCALNEFIDHVNHAPCGPLTPISETVMLPPPVDKCESLCSVVPVIDDQPQKQENDDGAEAFKELIEYTNGNEVGHCEIESFMESCENSVSDNYLLPEMEGILFQEIEPLTGEESLYIADPINSVIVNDNCMGEQTHEKVSAAAEKSSQGNELTPNDPFTIRLIELYKSNECLWSKGHPDHHNRAERNDVFQNMVDALIEEFQCSLTTQELNYKLNRLRYVFYRELRKMKTFESNNNVDEKFVPNLWFFDRLTFLKGNTSALLEVPKSKVLLDIIDGYYRCQCLWDKSHHDFRNRRVRHAAYDAIATTIELKYSIRTTRRSVVLQIKKLQTLYSQSVRSESEIQPENNSSKSLRTLLLKKLSFLRGNIRGCKEIQCTFCDEVFYSNSKYKLHYHKHTGNLPYACSICNKQFLHKPSLKAHEDTHLDVNDRPFTCEYCGLKIADRTNYRVHVQRHNGELQHECKICKKRVGTTTQLKNHMMDHTGERPHICDQCGKQYKSKSELTRHMRLHAARREFKCGYCVKAFHFQSQLDQHMLTHFAQPCDICGEEINGRRAFMRHKKQHY